MGLMNDLKFLYRFTDHQTAGSIDEWGDICGPSTTRVVLHKYPILKITPKGAWINIFGDKKFVLLTARKRFACPTEEEAKKSFVARKQRQIQINNASIHRAQEAIKVVGKTGDFKPLSGMGFSID